MGLRLAPILVIVFMPKIEAPVLEHRPVLYCRYIDDCFVVCSTQEQMDMCSVLLNTRPSTSDWHENDPMEAGFLSECTSEAAQRDAFNEMVQEAKQQEYHRALPLGSSFSD
ncbi:hypothetical protein V3C99_017674 [Haemonchus contortus]